MGDDSADSDHLPFRADLDASEQLLEDLLQPAYWQRLCPFLNVGRLRNAPTSAPVDTAVTAALKAEFIQNGFFQPQETLNEAGTCRKLAAGVRRLLLHGWPASFIFIYDEAWAVVEKMQPTLHAATGGSRFIGDVFAWHVDPAVGQRGWGPHRDRMGSGPSSFREDRTPMLSTSWLALTEATPRNSCLHVVPAGDDPGYYIQDCVDVDPLAAIFQGKPEAFQSIRCLTCPAGALWHFSHKIIHWGSFARTNAAPVSGVVCGVVVNAGA